MKNLARFLAFFLLCASNALADSVSLRTGERVIGKIIAEDEKKIVFESEGLGRLEISRERIEKLERTVPSTPEFVRPEVPVPPVVATNQPEKKPWFGHLGLWGRAKTTNDWIQLKSGEWLRGEIKAMQERKLEFDSEELDSQTFDWKDIRQLHSARWTDLWFTTEERASGPVDITPDTVTVGGDPPRVFPRSDLSSITPGGKSEIDHWSGKVSMGLTLRAGNTESVEYNAHAKLQRRTPDTRLNLEYLGNFSELGGEENANNHRATGEFDYWLTRRLFLLLPYVEFYKDRFQNLDRRLSGGVGLGYDVIDRPKLEWNIVAGPAYQHNWFHSVEPGEREESGGGALFFGTRFDWEISSRIDLLAEYRGQYSRPQIGATTHHGILTWEVKLSRRLDLDVSFIWDRISHPEADASGDTPKQDDFRLNVGLGLDF